MATRYKYIRCPHRLNKRVYDTKYILGCKNSCRPVAFKDVIIFEKFEIFLELLCNYLNSYGTNFYRSIFRWNNIIGFVFYIV